MTDYKLKAWKEISEQIDADSLAGYAGDFCADWDAGASSYFCDAFAEFADGRTSIYYYQIIKYISENVEAVNDAINELGWDGCGGDLYKAGRAAEFMQIERELQDNFDVIRAKLAADMLDADDAFDDIETAKAWRKLDEEKRAELVADFLDALDEIDSGDRIDSISDAFAVFLEAIKEAAWEANA